MLPLLNEAQNEEWRSEGVGRAHIDTDGEQNQLMIAYQSGRFLPAKNDLGNYIFP